MKIATLVGTALAATVLLSSNAQSREFGDIYMECGLGAMIFPTNNVMAAISNVTWDLGTTAVSSDASSEENCKGQKVAAASFIHQSYASLETELAEGQGEHVAALLDIMNCDTASQPGITTALRSDLASLVSTAGYQSQDAVQKSENFYNMLNNRLEGEFAKACDLS